MTTYWAELAWLPSGVVHDVRITCEGGVITEVHPRTHPVTGDIVHMGLTLPGAANGHSHAYHRALRGRTQAGNYWTWQQARQAVTDRLDPDTYLALARATFAEMALNGYTLVGEHHYLHRDPRGRTYTDPNAMGRALVQAADEAGVRLTVLDSLYACDGFDGNGVRPLHPAHIRFGDEDPHAWAQRRALLHDTELVRFAAGVHSVRTVPPAWLPVLGELTEHDPVVQVHVAQDPAEQAATLSCFGRTPVQLLHDAGLVTERTNLVHAIHITRADIALVGATGASVCLCPTTERDLAAGIAPARDLADAGARLCLGSDQHIIIDPFAELRALEMNERLTSNERVRFDADDLVVASSANGYDALGWSGGGRIEVGAHADLTTITLGSVRTLGSKPRHAPMVAMGYDVRQTVVAGRRVVIDGHHPLGRVEDLLADALTRLRSP